MIALDIIKRSMHLVFDASNKLALADSCQMNIASPFMGVKFYTGCLDCFDYSGDILVWSL